jgi:hypothetical protein
MSESAINRVPIELWQHILHLVFFLDFDEAEIPSWGAWRRRRAQYNITSDYHALCGERACLRLVNRCWNELVDQLPSTWVQLRTSEGLILSLDSIFLSLNNIPLPARVMPLLHRHTIQILSLACDAGSAKHIFPEVTRNAHTLPHLQALHVRLRERSADNTLPSSFPWSRLSLRIWLLSASPFLIQILNHLHISSFQSCGAFESIAMPNSVMSTWGSLVGSFRQFSGLKFPLWRSSRPLVPNHDGGPKSIHLSFGTQPSFVQIDYGATSRL